MKQTLNGDNPQYFFFYHNGLTALCEKLSLDSSTHQLKLDGLGVVNGCQSLNTILSCSERVKALVDARVLVRFTKFRNAIWPTKSASTRTPRAR
jgi:AIPR protein